MPRAGGRDGLRALAGDHVELDGVALLGERDRGRRGLGDGEVLPLDQGLRPLATGGRRALGHGVGHRGGRDRVARLGGAGDHDAEHVGVGRGRVGELSLRERVALTVERQGSLSDRDDPVGLLGRLLSRGCLGSLAIGNLDRAIGNLDGRRRGRCGVGCVDVVTGGSGVRRPDENRRHHGDEAHQERERASPVGPVSSLHVVHFVLPRLAQPVDPAHRIADLPDSDKETGRSTHPTHRCSTGRAPWSILTGDRR